MAFDFPNAPTVGQVFQGWIWDGEKWNSNTPIPSPATAPPIIDGTAAVGTSVKYAREDHIHPSDAAAQAVRYDTAQSLTSAQRSQARANIDVTKKNYVINGAFQINQGGYVSAAVLAAAAYGHDQWKAGAAGGDYSFTQSASSTTITIAVGKTLIQPIEDVRVTGGGSYVLAWTGTAQARAGVNTLTPAGAYAASPLLITGQTDGTVMSVEFNTGTLGSVSLTEGTVAPPFMVPDYASELAACKRYWQLTKFLTGIAYSTTAVSMWASHPGMRGAPTAGVVVGGFGITDVYLGNYNQSAAHIAALSNTSDAGTYNLDNFTGLTAGRFYMAVNTGAGWLALSARL
jgi:hypothetical protein